MPSNPYQGFASRSVSETDLSYSHLANQWREKTPELKEWLRLSVVGWRKEPVVKRIPYPTSSEFELEEAAQRNLVLFRGGDRRLWE